MQESRRNFLISLGGAAVLVFATLVLSGVVPLLPEGLRSTLSSLSKSSVAAPYWYNVIGASYAPYPGQTSCTAGSGGSCGYNCDSNPVYGAIDLQSEDGSAGSIGYVYQSGAAGNGGSSAPILATRTSSVILDYACTPGRSRANQHTECHYQACGKGVCQTCGCYGDAGSYETFSTSLTVTDPQGAVFVSATSPLYGSPTVQPAAGAAAGTYDAGQTVQFSLLCSGSATPATASVTMGPTVTVTSITANPTSIRRDLDKSTLTINASQAAADSCQLTGPGDVLIKTYSGTSIVNDTVEVGPLNATSTFQVKCLGPEGFNSRASVEVGVKTPPNLSITANNSPVQVIIPTDTSADIRWTSSNQTANSCSVTYTSSGGTCIAASNSIATQGAYQWKSFTIGSDTYLAVANAYDGISYVVDSNIYKWISSLGCFGKDSSSACGAAFQTISTSGAAAWEPFTIGSDTYLALANSRNDSTRNVDSKIYKWLSAQECFGSGTACGSAYQSIPTSGAVHLKPVTSGSTMFLAVANYRNDTSYAIDSGIYRWMSSGVGCPAGGGFGDGTTCGAVLQSVPTEGAYRMESFVLDGGLFLAVTNAFSGGTGSGYNLPSYIYKHTNSGLNCPAGGGFGNGRNVCGVPFQTIYTSGAYGWKFFTVGNVSYLGVANSFDGSSFNINSKIFQWMPGSQCFGDGTTCGAAFQLLPTNGATQLQIFTVGPEVYLIAANAYTGVSYNINSNFYKWMPGSQCFGNGSSCGAAFQAVPTSGVAWWEPVVVGDRLFLAAANYFNGTTRSLSSSLMEWSSGGCSDEELGTPTVWTEDQSPVPSGYPTGLFSGMRTYTLSCKWIDGTTSSSTNVKVVQLPELILSANGSTTNPVYITPGTSGVVKWSSKNVQQNSCSVSNNGNSTVWTSDNNSTGYATPVLADQEQIVYTLSCTDLLGDPTNRVMTVVGAIPVPLTANMSLSASRTLKGARPTIKWSVTGITSGISCGISPQLQGGASSSNWDGTGAAWSSPAGGALGPIITSSTTFTLRCINKAGDSASVSAVAYLIPAFIEI